jgi:hypothetical protein
MTSELTNLFFCPDECFESDLDINFKQTLQVLDILKVEGIDKHSFLRRPDEENDPN